MITKDNNLRVLRIFFESPEKSFHIRQLARMAGISSTGAIKIVKRLKKSKLLKSKKKRMVEEVEADFEGRFQPVKRAYNLLSLYDSGLVEALNGHYEEPKTIVLFGSYSEGTDTSKSDIDIAVVTKRNDMPGLDIFERKLKRDIKLLTVSIDQSSKEFRNSLSNGIVLSGYLEVVA